MVPVVKQSVGSVAMATNAEGKCAQMQLWKWMQEDDRTQGDGFFRFHYCRSLI